VERDLRRQYGNRYRSWRLIPARELGIGEAVEVAHDPVALFLVDQRMPRCRVWSFGGAGFYPDAKRALLTLTRIPMRRFAPSTP